MIWSLGFLLSFTSSGARCRHAKGIALPLCLLNGAVKGGVRGWGGTTSANEFGPPLAPSGTLHRVPGLPPEMRPAGGRYIHRSSPEGSAHDPAAQRIGIDRVGSWLALEEGEATRWGRCDEGRQRMAGSQSRTGRDIAKTSPRCDAGQ